MEDVLEDELEGLLADGILSGSASSLRTASASSAASSSTASRSMPAESRSILGRATRTQSSIQSSSRTERPHTTAPSPKQKRQIRNRHGTESRTAHASHADSYS